MSRHGRGEGSIYQRKDGRWAGSVFVDTVSGKRKRIHVYRKTRTEVHEALSEHIRQARRGIRTPDKTWTVGAYVDYWINHVVATKNRPSTLENYRGLARNHLANISSYTLSALTVQRTQRHFNNLRDAGVGGRTVEATRSLLRAVLSHAERDELIVRNVAKLIQIPSAKPAPVRPWSSEEVDIFLRAAEDHRWYAAYVLLLRLGLRRGEVLGLTWDCIDDHEQLLTVSRQLQRIDGRLQLVPLKTDASQRRLALVGQVARAIDHHRKHAERDQDLVFTSSTGTPIDPKNFVRTFHEIRRKAGLRRIKLHHARHTAATLLKQAGVSAKDAQLILGHAHITTTQQIYQHGDEDGQRDALLTLETALNRAGTGGRGAVRSAVKHTLSTGQSVISDALTSGGPSETRTQDTLLKSWLWALPNDTVTSVAQRIRTRAHMHILGFAAVRNCCQFEQLFLHDDRPLDWLEITKLPDRLRLIQLTTRSFPHCLLPPR